MHQVLSFQKILMDANYSVFIRSSRGADISAACGQLAGKEEADHQDLNGVVPA
jgi:23S rRNA (adenine2503-C2)-methyltransferase